MKLIKENIILSLLLLVLFIMMLLQLWSSLYGSGINVENYFYWLFAIIWVYCVRKFRMDVGKTTGTALAFFVLGVFLASLRANDISEYIFRTSFVLWMIGIFHILFELRGEKTSKNK